MKNLHARYIELDLLRTLAILGMIVYHTAFDLSQFYGWHIDVFTGWWKIEQVAVANLFLLLVGITSSFSHRHILKRFLRIGGAALLVTIATYIVDPETYVRFGVLHLIAVSALLLPLVARMRSWSIIGGMLLIATNPIITSLHSTRAWHATPLLLSIGITYPGFDTVDYFPLIPWFGAVLIGYGIGHLAYIQYPHWRWVPEITNLDLSFMQWPGKHSLILYLIHQPIIISILWMILGKPAF